MAKSRNDRTVVHIKSPFDNNNMDSQLANIAGGNEMLKKMASSFLSKDTTVMEYDMGQVRSMQSGIIFSMLIMWFLHFKMQQVQPLLITILNSTLQLFYNPLFQVYVLGRNLERPFVTAKPEWVKKAEELREEQKKSATEAEAEAAIEEEEEEEEDKETEMEMTIEEVEEEVEEEMAVAEEKDEVADGDDDEEEQRDVDESE
jgi:Phosphate transport (Pho88)